MIMLKDLTWNFFEKTGSVEAFLVYNQLQNTKTGDEKSDNAEGKGINN